MSDYEDAKAYSVAALREAVERKRAEIRLRALGMGASHIERLNSFATLAGGRSEVYAFACNALECGATPETVINMVYSVAAGNQTWATTRHAFRSVAEPGYAGGGAAGYAGGGAAGYAGGGAAGYAGGGAAGSSHGANGGAGRAPRRFLPTVQPAPQIDAHGDVMRALRYLDLWLRGVDEADGTNTLDRAAEYIRRAANCRGPSGRPRQRRR